MDSRSPLGQEESMVDRVADALTILMKRGRGAPVDLARAAIEAMREPTEAMALAGYTGEMCEGHSTENAWRQMIDAALTKPSAAAP